MNLKGRKYVNRRPPTAYITGPIDMDYMTFLLHYQKSIDIAIKLNHHFITGSSDGAEKYALIYLLKHAKISRNRVQIVCFENYEDMEKTYKVKCFDYTDIKPSVYSICECIHLYTNYDIAYAPLECKFMENILGLRKRIHIQENEKEKQKSPKIERKKDK